MHDLPLAIPLDPYCGKAGMGALAEASDYGHISVVADFLLDVGRKIFFAKWLDFPCALVSL